MTDDGLAVEQFTNIEAEASLIGGLLLDNSLFDRVGCIVRAEDFFVDRHRELFAEIALQIMAGKACDVVTVASALQGKVGIQDVHAMAQFLPSQRMIDHYAQIVLERSKSRQMLAAVAKISELAHDHKTPLSDRISMAQAEIGHLSKEVTERDWLDAETSMVGHLEILESRVAGTITAWPTGLDDLDEYLDGGLRPGELVIVGARPSMGKTALGMSIGIHMAEQLSVGMLSMEMSHSEVNDRLVAMLSRVSMSSVKRPARGDGLKWDRVVEGVERVRRLRFSVSDQGGLNLNQVKAKARALKRTKGLDVLIVDYIGLMSGMNPSDNRNTQLGEISRGLKSLAKELQLAVVCLAQLNRKAEERPNQMPQMSDLRDSGEIEQDADVILFVKRPIMANPELGDEWKNYAKVSVAKNRQGRCGLLDLCYIGEQTRFVGWSGPAPKAQLARRGGDL